jgi:hypothetical protein
MNDQFGVKNNCAPTEVSAERRVADPMVRPDHFGAQHQRDGDERGQIVEAAPSSLPVSVPVMAS